MPESTPYGMTIQHTSNVVWDVDRATAYYVLWSDIPAAHPSRKA